MTTHPAAEVELRRKLHDIADHLHRNPNTLSIHRIPQALDLIVTALASLEQGIEDQAKRIGQLELQLDQLQDDHR